MMRSMLAYPSQICLALYLQEAIALKRQKMQGCGPLGSLPLFGRLIGGRTERKDRIEGPASLSSPSFVR